ncbi:MAG: TrkH family potassium uptake protein [Firmicutes bacterium]|nr:TrkH family potassium uptake protein [Bacillota bacterium]
MNISLVINLIGKSLIFLGLTMIFPLFWAIYYQGPDQFALLFSIVITLTSGLVVCYVVPAKGDIRYREGFAIVTFGWLLASAYGGLPYLLSGACRSFPDAFFESMSGFTTTGASVITDVEALPKGVLFWRSLTHWLGGMGIIVFLVALLSHLGVGANQMFRAEVPGPVAEKIRPRISETAKILWFTYLIMTVVQTGLLWFLGMPLFDALCHTFGTLATGGFSTKNASIGFYDSAAIQWVIIIFMFLSGVNFALYYQALRGRSLKTFWINEEFRFYLVIVLVATALTAYNIRPLIGEGEALVRTAAFQVASIITTTGFATVDFNLWPSMSQAVLVSLMFIGACSGSTGGAIKVGRILILLRQGALEMKRLIHPRAVFALKIEGKSLSEDLVINVLQFFFLYLTIVGVFTIVMTATGLDLITAFTSVAATFGNVGPGLGLVGPASNYSMISGTGKLLLSFLMLLGRLEIYTVLVLFSLSFWKR